jgi:GGDEF domain-containing protein
MNINVTLFIQAFHFYIVYYLLERFLFRPIVGQIMHEQGQKAESIASIEKLDKTIAHAQAMKQKRWQECQQDMQQKKPTDLEQPMPTPSESLHIPIIDPDRVKSLSDQLGHTIIKRVLNDT